MNKNITTSLGVLGENERLTIAPRPEDIKDRNLGDVVDIILKKSGELKEKKHCGRIKEIVQSGNYPYALALLVSVDNKVTEDYIHDDQLKIFIVPHYV